MLSLFEHSIFNPKSILQEEILATKLKGLHVVTENTNGQSRR